MNHQCIKDVMYGDDSYLLAPSALGLQKLLESVTVLVRKMRLYLIP